MRNLSLLSLVLASCTHDIAVFDEADVQQARDLDILFVFDNSGDRGTYDEMASQLDTLQARLKDVDGQVPNLHVGVVSTDLGTRGTKDSIAPLSTGRCSGDGDAAQLTTFAAGLDGNFLEDLRGPDGTRIRNFASGDLTLELGKLTNPAAGAPKSNTGCEFEQPLEAMRRALDPNTNAGFVRAGAMLSVVFLTNEDDCSLARGAMLDANDTTLGPLTSFRCTEQGVICDPDDPRRPGEKINCRPREDSRFMVDVSEYTDFLATVKSNPRDVVVSAVAGARTPFVVKDIGGPVLASSCQGAGGTATPAVRLGAVVDAFGGALVDGCAQDAAYQQITAPVITRQRQGSCFPNLRRDDGENCIVTEVSAGVESELARCADGSPSPCWFTYADPTACPTGDNIGIAVARGRTTAPERSRISATCFAR